MRHGAAPVVRGHVLIEQRLQADSLEEVLDEGERAQAFAA